MRTQRSTVWSWRFTALGVGLMMACVVWPGLFRAALQAQDARRIEVAGAGTDADSGRRVALVIGNSAYTGTSPLVNPENDATDMAEMLGGLGFQVILRLDADEDTMDNALSELEVQSAGADMALVFYAGHGMELDGLNYLVPVDARLETASAVARETIMLDSVLGATLGARTRIVILDACRNNPFARSMRDARSRNVRSGGLAAVSTGPGSGLLVAYAAAAGDVAADGDGRNSPYTKALLQHLESPALDVRLMLGNVGAAVRESTGADQQPFIYTSLAGEHLLMPGDRPIEVPTPPVDIAQLNTAQLRAIAEDGDVRAQLMLGTKYRLGEGTGRDYEEAAKWYRLAAQQGNASAQINLGFLYMGGTGVPQDYEEGARLFRLAAEQGHPAGQAALGRMYHYGLGGLPQDDREALRLYRLGADADVDWGQNGLGEMYASGRGGVRQDYEEAAKWFRLAADQGMVAAQANLGYLYVNGLGVPQDVRRAVQWFRTAADQGHADAQFKLGVSYANGLGVPQDVRRAVQWFRTAADQGHADAQFQLGVLYANGVGVPQDFQEAVRWFRMAATQGHPAAQDALNRYGLASWF